LQSFCPIPKNISWILRLAGYFQRRHVSFCVSGNRLHHCLEVVRQTKVAQGSPLREKENSTWPRGVLASPAHDATMRWHQQKANFVSNSQLPGILRESHPHGNNAVVKALKASATNNQHQPPSRSNQLEHKRYGSNKRCERSAYRRVRFCEAFLPCLPYMPVYNHYKRQTDSRQETADCRQTSKRDRFQPKRLWGHTRRSRDFQQDEVPATRPAWLVRSALTFRDFVPRLELLSPFRDILGI